jgi:phosphoribosylamine-glycine ligase
MKVLVIGGGGREHALAWKIGASPRVDRVFVAPGNAGAAADAENVDIADTDVPKLVAFAKQNAIDLAVVGPEASLAAGIVDAVRTCSGTPMCRRPITARFATPPARRRISPNATTSPAS